MNTDTLGLASTLVTLGATLGTQTFRAAATRLRARACSHNRAASSRRCRLTAPQRLNPRFSPHRLSPLSRSKARLVLSSALRTIFASVMGMCPVKVWSALRP